jgi:hypothetical protein
MRSLLAAAVRFFFSHDLKFVVTAGGGSGKFRIVWALSELTVPGSP